MISILYTSTIKQTTMNPFKFLRYFFKNEITFDEIQFLREKSKNIDAILEAYKIKSFRGYNVLLTKDHIQVSKYHNSNSCFYYDFKENAFSFRGMSMIDGVPNAFKLNFYNDVLRLDILQHEGTYYKNEFIITLKDFDDINIYNTSDDDIVIITLAVDRVNDLPMDFVNNFLCIV